MNEATFTETYTEALAVEPTRLTYTIEQAMNILQISRATMYKLVQDGNVRSFNIGRRRFVSHEAIMNFIRESEEAGAAAEA